MRQEDYSKDPERFPAGFVISFFLFLAFVFTLYVRGLPPNGDPVNYYVTAASISQNGSPGLHVPHRLVPMERGRNGQYYSKFGIGQSLLELPFYKFSRAIAPESEDSGYLFSFTYFISVLGVPLVSALACVFVLLACTELGFTRPAAFVTAGALGLCTMIFPYATQGFSEALQACAVAGALLYAVRAREGRGGWSAALCGAWLGVLLLTKTATAVVAPVFGLYLLAAPGGRNSKTKNFVLFCAAFALFAAAALYYNYMRFGDWLDFGYSGGRDGAMGFNTPLLAGLYGLLFSPGKSVFLYAPAVLISLAFAGAFHRRRPAESVLVWVCCALVVLVYARWWAWHGDWAWGPRFLVPLLPLAALPAAECARGFGKMHAAGRAACVAVLMVSFGVQALAVTVNFYEYMTIVRKQVPHSAFFTPGRPNLRDDQLYTHFVPDFSPVAGQLWLFRHPGRNGDFSGGGGDFPWKGLMGYAEPHVSPGALEPDTWTAHFPIHYPQSAGWVNRWKAVLWLLVAMSFAGMVVNSKQSEDT